MDHIDRPATTANRATTLPRDVPDPDTADAHAIVVLFSPDERVLGRMVRLSSERLPIGRSPGADGLAFEDPLVSRLHAAVHWEPARERFLVVDEDSRNGTLLNGGEVPREVLSPGDVLRLGDTVLRFCHLDLEVVGWEAPEETLLRGRSRQLRRVLDDLQRVAPTDMITLVLGATGTGKELVARELHRLSRRRGPFVAVNCAAIPPDLLESELFGHRRGAFSGAVADQKGLVRAAEGGTLFLDEIGEMAAPLQAKLLRMLDEKRVRPVGGRKSEPFDARLVFATNRDLAGDVEEDRFRGDLYARINEWPVQLAPLRERPEDLLPIARHVLATRGAGARHRITGDFFEALALHDWPFNVRELVALLRRAIVLLPDGGPLGLEHLPREMRPGRAAKAETAPNGRSVGVPPEGEAPTGQELVALMEHYEGNVADVARHTARDRVQVYRWLRRHGLQPDDFRGRRGGRR